MGKGRGGGRGRGFINWFLLYYRGGAIVCKEGEERAQRRDNAMMIPCVGCTRCMRSFKVVQVV
jgi:hypothetical protein